MNMKEFMRDVLKNLDSGEVSLKSEELSSMGLTYEVIPRMFIEFDQSPGEEDSYLIISLEEGIFKLPCFHDTSYYAEYDIILNTDNVEDCLEGNFERINKESIIAEIENDFILLKNKILNL